MSPRLAAFILFAACAPQPKPKDPGNFVDVPVDTPQAPAAPSSTTSAPPQPASSPTPPPPPPASSPPAAATGVYGRNAVAAFDAMAQTDRDALKKVKVLFHHHSIGENIMGLWTDDHQPGGAVTLGFPFGAAKAPSDYATLGLGETTGGSNGQPETKLASLQDIVVGQRFGAAVQALLFKLCFIDFGSGSTVNSLDDVHALAAKYKSTMQAISAATPGLRVVHITPPLNNYWNSAGNDLRAELARFLRDEYGGNGFVFDLEDVISHDAQGNPCVHDNVPVICDAYVGGSGHLSHTGATLAAKGLLYTVWQATRAR
jgi:hypothetical protein